MALLGAALVVAYAAIVQWVWGWPSILEGWAQVGFARVALALALLVATYFVRTHRIQDYFPRETKGRFVRLLPRHAGPQHPQHHAAVQNGRDQLSAADALGIRRSRWRTARRRCWC